MDERKVDGLNAEEAIADAAHMRSSAEPAALASLLPTGLALTIAGLKGNTHFVLGERHYRAVADALGRVPDPIFAEV